MLTTPTLNAPPRSARSRGPRWGLLLTGLLTVSAISAAAAYGFLHRRAIPTLQVTRGTVVRAFYATGTVRPELEYPIKSKVQGHLVTLAVREGDPVQKGQVLAEILDPQLKLEVEKAQAELAEALAKSQSDAPLRLELLSKLQEARQQLEISDRQLDRLEKMSRVGAASLADVDAARRIHVQYFNLIAGLESQLGNWQLESKKSLQVAQANARKAQAHFDDATLRSPIDGLVLERHVEIQELVGVNQKLLLLARRGDLIMKAAVDEEDITRTALEQEVQMQLYAYAVKTFSGRVTKILPISDPLNKTYEVWIRFDQLPGGLRVGMTAELNFLEEVHQNAVIIPVSSWLDGRVYRKTAQGFAAQSVELGIRNPEKFEVLSGLGAGEEIALDAKQVAPAVLPKAKLPVVPTRRGDVKDAAP